MMRIRLRRLYIYGNYAVDQVDLDHDIVYIHGEIAVGKTTVLNLIDYCFGANWKPTLAVQQTVNGIRLDLSVGDCETMIERRIGENRARVTWRDLSGETFSFIVPFRDDASLPVAVEPDVKTLSDVIMHLWNVGPLRVKQSMANIESRMIRLSIRDFLPYCYLRQSDMDSSFFRMEDPFRRRKSQDVMRLMAGYNTERLAKLEERLQELREKRSGGLATLGRIREVLSKGELLGTRDEILTWREMAASEFSEARAKLNELDRGYRSATSDADGLRNKLRALELEVDAEARRVDEISQRIRDSESLRDEYVALLFQTDQALAAKEILGDALYEFCPACAASLPHFTGLACYVCKEPRADRPSQNMLFATREDLNSRVDDLGRSIELQDLARASLLRHLEKIRDEKTYLDSELVRKLERYDDNYLSAYRDAERRAARSQEQEKRYTEILRLYERLDEMGSSLESLTIEMNSIRGAVVEEEKALVDAAEIVSEIESKFGSLLLKVGVPDFSARDYVQIEARSWFPRLRRRNDPGVYWDFESASSGGTTVLFKICYALAVHAVASKHDLNLPSLLMIDTPTKNIAEDINPETIKRLFATIYKMAEDELEGTQLILVDSEVHSPSNAVDFLDIKYTRESPLITGFRSADQSA